MFPVLYKFELVTLFVITLNRASKLKRLYSRHKT